MSDSVCYHQQSPSNALVTCVIASSASDGLTDQNSKPKSFEHAAIVLCMGDVPRPWFSRCNPTAAQIYGQSRQGQWRGATADREVLRLRQI